jgi:hypothetical protein
MVNKLYIWDENVPNFRERLLLIEKGFVTLIEFDTPIQFGIDRGVVKPVKINNRTHVYIFTVGGIFIFSNEEIKKLIYLLDQLEKAGMPEK